MGELAPATRLPGETPHELALRLLDGADPVLAERLGEESPLHRAVVTEALEALPLVGGPVWWVERTPGNPASVVTVGRFHRAVTDPETTLQQAFTLSRSAIGLAEREGSHPVLYEVEGSSGRDLSAVGEAGAVRYVRPTRFRVVSRAIAVTQYGQSYVLVKLRESGGTPVSAWSRDDVNNRVSGLDGRYTGESAHAAQTPPQGSGAEPAAHAGDPAGRCRWRSPTRRTGTAARTRNPRVIMTP